MIQTTLTVSYFSALDGVQNPPFYLYGDNLSQFAITGYPNTVQTNGVSDTLNPRSFVINIDSSQESAGGYDIYFSYGIPDEEYSGANYTGSFYWPGQSSGTSSPPSTGQPGCG